MAWDGKQLRISASIGVALYPEHGQDERTLVDRADHAMYVAKKAGGDRVLVTDSAVEPAVAGDPPDQAIAFG